MNLENEEEVRTKLVMGWLTQKGIEPDNILIEHTVKYQIGRNEKPKNPRYDILVTSSKSDKNLIIFEIKAPTVQIDNSAIDQAISYARILKGNMAPIVVLTNSVDTKVFCSITRTELGIDINIDNLLGGLPQKEDKDLNELKYEAISLLSNRGDFIPDICDSISSEELERLSGTLFDGKKYCQDTYFPLENTPKFDANVILVSGPPQSGKTNFLCHCYDALKKEKKSVIFLRAKSMKNGLIKCLTKKIMGLALPNNTTELILNRVLSDKNLTFIVDGINEVDRQSRDTIIDELTGQRKQGANLILSCVASSLKTIKQDSEGSPCYLFKNNNNNNMYLEISLPILNDEKYNNIINHYKKISNTSFEPFSRFNSINSIGKFYYLVMSGHNPEKFETEYDVLKLILNEKCEVINNIESIDCKKALLFLANEMANSVQRIDSCRFNEILNKAQFSLLPYSFSNQGLLEEIEGFIDFYDESFRDILLIEQFYDTKKDIEIIEILSQFKNKDISEVCTFKFLCFYNISEEVLFKLGSDTQTNIIESILQYIQVSRKATNKIINTLISLIKIGIDNNNITTFEAKDHLFMIADICREQPGITIKGSDTQFILGYCCCEVDTDLLFGFEEHPIHFYSEENTDLTLNNCLGLLYYNNLIRHDGDGLDSDFEGEISMVTEHYGEEALPQLARLYEKIVNYFLCYEPYMCSVGSDLSNAIEEYKNDADPDTLLGMLNILNSLKAALHTSNFDEVISEIKHELRGEHFY